MTKMPADKRYWVLYEGTPGGQYDETDWWMTPDKAKCCPDKAKCCADQPKCCPAKSKCCPNKPS